MRSPLRKSDNVIHDGSAVRVVRLRAGEEAVVDPLGDDDVSELHFAEAGVLEGVLDGLDLSLHDVGDLAVPNSIPRIMTFRLRLKRHVKTHLNMKTLSGRHPLTSMYFRRALVTPGFMVLFSSWLGLSWRLAMETNLVKLPLIEATRAPTDLPLCRVS